MTENDPIVSGSTSDKLDAWYRQIEAVFLQRLSPAAGLLPASTAKTVHGDYAHAWVRDNVYSVLGIWALSCAYRRDGSNMKRAADLEANVVRLMRGLLTAMMRQSHKVETFKHTQNPLDGLHAKYDADTGMPVVEDDGWGHLQIDATSLFLLFLAQMTTAGIRIVETRDELDFVQNVVHYICPAYRIADYGIWERGRKSNDGVVEINASSVGIAKAALEAIDGLLLLGESEPPIQVPPDDIARARETLQVLLPGESASKETDAALLAIIGWPAFAVDDKVLVGHTRARILDRLAGRYGCKRFLRDGHQTSVEDEHRLHYHAGELSKFANIESEWPLFFTYLLIDSEMTLDKRGSDAWYQRLVPLFLSVDGMELLPELYFVPEHAVADEAALPGSQIRQANSNVPLLWAQSQWIVGALLREKLIEPSDIDPLERRHKVSARAGTQISFCLVVEDLEAQALLREQGLAVETMDQVAAYCDIRPAGDLVDAWTRIGANESLGLSGRPEKRLGALANAWIYQTGDRPMVISTTLLEAHDHHIRYDAAARARRIRGDLRYVSRHWRENWSPLFVLTLDKAALTSIGANRLIELLLEVNRGQVDFARTHMVSISEVLKHSMVRRAIGDVMPLAMHGTLPRLYNDIDAAHLMGDLEHAIQANDYERVEHLYEGAGRLGDWLVARKAAAWLKRTDPRLQDSAKDIVVRLRRLDLGDNQILVRPVSESELVERIDAAFNDGLLSVLAQEVLQALGLFSKSDSTAVRGMRTIRLKELVLNLMSEAQKDGLNILCRPPSDVFDRVKAILLETPSVRAVIAPAPHFTLMPSALAVAGDWRQWRERLGILTRVGSDFFARLWSLLHVCNGIVFGMNNRLDAAIARSDLTAWEKDFALEIERRLEDIPAPAYRALCLEALNALANQHESNPEFGIESDFVLDHLVHKAASRIWEERFQTPADWSNPEPIWTAALCSDAQSMAKALFDEAGLLCKTRMEIN